MKRAFTVFLVSTWVLGFGTASLDAQTLTIPVEPERQVHGFLYRSFSRMTKCWELAFWEFKMAGFYWTSRPAAVQRDWEARGTLAAEDAGKAVREHVSEAAAGLRSAVGDGLHRAIDGNPQGEPVASPSNPEPRAAEPARSTGEETRHEAN